MLIEHEVGERVRVPLVVALSTEVENLHVELSGSVDSTIIKIRYRSQFSYSPVVSRCKLRARAVDAYTMLL